MCREFSQVVNNTQQANGPQRRVHDGPIWPNRIPYNSTKRRRRLGITFRSALITREYNGWKMRKVQQGNEGNAKVP
ncbi:hypothetical protein OUZ56_007163 [Daphnia magna]|uniref:Uncharacterized protein n=1 Tax=Daphnia magna TaxID=35525 RepID=A0ABQ9YXU5_9CRUS|nr:hypothetical protein OUZ56_007163 [Daphnia magna]